MSRLYKLAETVAPEAHLVGNSARNVGLVSTGRAPRGHAEVACKHQSQHDQNGKRNLTISLAPAQPKVQLTE